MKKLLITVVIIFTASLLLGQNRFMNTISKASEDGFIPLGHVIQYGRTILETYPGSIPGTSNFWDYQTNGSNLNAIVVRNDTIIVVYPSADSTDATGATTRVNFYTISTDAGATWTTPIPLTTLPNRSAYPEVYYYNSQGSAGAVFSGRRYNGSNSRGGAWSDPFLGIGAFVTSYVPEPGRDFFGAPTTGNTYGGLFSSPLDANTDSLFFCKYDFVNNAMSGKTLIAAPPTGITGSVRYRLAASGNNLLAMWYDNTTGLYAMRYKTSTDGGTTWGSMSAMQVSRGLGGVVNGDTCSPWFGIDAAFKPGTSTWGAVWSTLYNTGAGQNSAYNTACKILFSSPGINGGLPVEVAGRSNMTIIADTNLFLDRLSLQVGVTPVSHPSIAYSSDGSRICVAFSTFQPGDTLDGFTFNDIWITYSDNGGLTWASPSNLTSTHNWDELYPVLSETGNTATSFKVEFQATRVPGSQSFTDASPVYRVYHAYKVFNPQSIGVQNIGTSVPEKFLLKQNYPNPFNPVTKIRFDVSKASVVTLKVYNILGQLVETLIDGENLTAGTKEISFDGTALNSGIYFYTLTSANGFKETKKMMLIK